MERHTNLPGTSTATIPSNKDATGPLLQPQILQTLPGRHKRLPDPNVLLPKISPAAIRTLVPPTAQISTVVAMLLRRSNGSSVESRPVIQCARDTPLRQLIGAALARSHFPTKTVYLTKVLVLSKQLNRFVDVPFESAAQDGAVYEVRLCEDSPAGAQRITTGEAAPVASDHASTSKQLVQRQVCPLHTVVQWGQTSDVSGKANELGESRIALNRTAQPGEIAVPNKMPATSRKTTTADASRAKKKRPTKLAGSCLSSRNDDSH